MLQWNDRDISGFEKGRHGFDAAYENDIGMQLLFRGMRSDRQDHGTQSPTVETWKNLGRKQSNCLEVRPVKVGAVVHQDRSTRFDPQLLEAVLGKRRGIKCSDIDPMGDDMDPIAIDTVAEERVAVTIRDCDDEIYPPTQFELCFAKKAAAFGRRWGSCACAGGHR